MAAKLPIKGHKLKKFRRKYRNLHIAVAKFSEFRGKYGYF